MTPTTQIATGIPGLDELLTGGLVTNRMYLIEGNPGTGKTTLAMQFLQEGRDAGEKTLYVTLSETSVELDAIAASHGWSLEGIELFHLAPAETRLQDEYTLYHPAEIELGDTIKAVLEVIDRVHPTRVVFDSLSELQLLARDPLRYRRQILALKDYFSGRQCTVMLLDDLSSGSGDRQLQSLCHAVIMLELLPFEYGRARRRVRVSKYRGVAAIEGFHDFRIRKGGIEVFPQLVPGSESTPRSTESVPSGIAELDQLLGGGLAWGTTTLIIGPAGAGKSTLAAQYAASGITRARAAIFLFDERLGTFVARCEALGMDIESRVADGSVRIEQIDPGQMSPGQFSSHVRAVVEAGARVLMIDSLNGYLNAIPQIEGPLVRMHELLSYLNEKGVSTIMIVAQHGIVGTQMATPIDVSYLADTVVLLRFFEAHGTVRRALSVMKKRSGTHESTIREFQLGPDRLRVGEALSDFQGVLTGVPQFVGGSKRLLDENK